MSLETWLLFSSAALVVILIPGPLSLLMISNSLNYGLRRSYPAFLGGVFASICLLSASALGLGALLLASEKLFSALKIVGALYLFYLAWQSWKQSRQPATVTNVPDAAPIPRFGALFGRAFDIAGRELVIMDLRARFSNGADDGGVAGHVLRHIGDNREGGDNPEFLLRRGRRRGQQGDGQYCRK